MALCEWGPLALYTDIMKFLKSLRNVRWVTLFKNYLRNFDPSINIALVNGGCLHYKDMKKFLRNHLLWNHRSDVEIISQKCSQCDPFQKLFHKNFDPSINMALVNGSCLHYTGLRKFLNCLLLWNCRSDFESISQKFSLVDPFWKLLQKFDPSRRMSLVIGGYLHYRVPRGSVVGCLTRNPGVLGSSCTRSSGFFCGSVGKTIQSLA